MSTITNILIPTDFSKTASLAVAHGAHMAQLFNAKIYLLHSVEGTLLESNAGDPLLVQAAERAYSLAAEQINNVAEEIKKKYEAEVVTLTVKGKPASAIADAVKAHNIDIIVMGTHGASGFKEFFIGSNAHKVINLSPCPIISIRSGTKKVGFSNIIMPITIGLYSRQKVNNVVELAVKYNSTVHIIELLETRDIVDENKFGIKMESVEKTFEKNNIKFTRKRIRAKNPAVEAITFSKEVKGDLIIIMTDHESDMTGMFLGTVAKQIVDYSDVPVMSIRPVETMVMEAFDPAGGSGTI